AGSMSNLSDASRHSEGTDASTVRRRASRCSHKKGASNRQSVVCDLSMVPRVLLGAILLVVSGPRLATAACPGDVNYTGPANGLWDTPGNWDANQAPTGAQPVCIPAGKGTITIGAGVAAAAKDITAASGLAIAATGSLSISDSSSALPFPNSVADLSIASGGTLTSAGSGVSIAGQAVVDGSLASMATLVSGSLS